MNTAMTQKVSITGALLVATLLAEVATAQAPLPATPGAATVGRFVSNEDGIHSGGERYRVRFGRDGVHYTPALGRQAPRTMPWRFALESVGRGGEPVFGATPSGVAPQRDGATVDYRHGPGVVERYEVRGDGVKQSFVFDRLPGSGDLVVRGRVTSELKAAAAFGAEAVDFTCGDIGGVRVAGVLGVDAVGQRADGTMNWDGRTLELVLPAAFVDRARFPLVLDPLIGTYLNVGGGTHDDSNPDAAWLEPVGAYLIAWQREFSTGDIEVRARLVTAANVGVGSWFWITNGSDALNLNPSVAAVGGRGRFVVAWQAGASMFGPFDIHACSVDAAGNVGPIALITAQSAAGTTPTAGSERFPDLAGKPDSSTSTFVIYESQSVGIETRQINVSPSGDIASGAARLIAADPAATRPRVSNGSAVHHGVVWQSRNSSGFDTVAISRVDASGQSSANTATISSTTDDRRTPDIDGDGVDFKAVWDSRAGSNAIEMLDVTFPGNWTTYGQSYYVKQTSVTQAKPTIAWCGPKYLVMWTEMDNLFNFWLRGQAVADEAGLHRCGVEFTPTPTLGPNIEPAIASQRGGSGNGAGRQEALMVYASIEFNTLRSDVLSQVYRCFEGATPQVMSPGCGSPVALSTNGPVALGNQSLAFEMSTTNAAPAIGLFLYGFGATQPCPTGGGCVAVAPLTSAVRVFAAPGQTLMSPVPMPCDAIFVGLPLEVQGVVVGAPSGACALYPEASLSARKRYVLDY